MLGVIPCTLEHANEDVLKLAEVLEHSMSLKVLQVQTVKDVFVVNTILVQSNTVIVKALQTINKIPFILLLHSTLCR